ncbi:MAG TPA: acetolactate synthase small subunit, partial [Blastocatellia bacterium]|nr:acetolactate synthase small subunit [Blastocatellia bacterium]
MRHTISLLVENEYGMLTRVAGLFSARGYQIDTLNVAPTLEDGVSRMTITTHGNDHVIEQIIQQSRKLVRIIEVT